MQAHRDTAEAGMREVWAYLVLLRTQKFFGEVTLKFREGVVVGHVHEHRDQLVSALPQATPEQIAALDADVLAMAQVVKGLSIQPPHRLNRAYDKDRDQGVPRRAGKG